MAADENNRTSKRCFSVYEFLNGTLLFLVMIRKVIEMLRTRARAVNPAIYLASAVIECCDKETWAGGLSMTDVSGKKKRGKKEKKLTVH